MICQQVEDYYASGSGGATSAVAAGGYVTITPVATTEEWDFPPVTARLN